MRWYPGDSQSDWMDTPHSPRQEMQEEGEGVGVPFWIEGGRRCVRQ